MAVIPDFKSTTLIAFLKQNVEPGTVLYTDGLKSFTGLGKLVTSMCLAPNLSELRKGTKSFVPGRPPDLATYSSG